MLWTAPFEAIDELRLVEAGQRRSESWPRLRRLD
jgi:hypothetical protein